MNFGFYAPAGFTTDAAAVDRAEQRLRGLGYGVVRDATVGGRHQRFAAPDDERLAAVARMAGDAAIDVPCAVRGGYGWTRLLDRLDFDALAHAGKRWLGHSDFTAFTLAMLARTGMVTYAGPMVGYDFGAAEPSTFTLEQCFGVLGAREWEVTVPLDGPRMPALTGALWGGNLALCAHLVGTPYFPQVEGGILVLEDVGEQPYRLERMMYQLLHAGVLSRQRAIVLGAFTEYTLSAHDGGYTLDTVIAHLRERGGVPVYTGLPFGHVRDKLTLPIGCRCTLVPGEGDARLVFRDYVRR